MIKMVMLSLNIQIINFVKKYFNQTLGRKLSDFLQPIVFTFSFHSSFLFFIFLQNTENVIPVKKKKKKKKKSVIK